MSDGLHTEIIALALVAVNQQGMKRLLLNMFAGRPQLLGQLQWSLSIYDSKVCHQYRVLASAPQSAERTLPDRKLGNVTAVHMRK
jgi:hypothetical protein